MSPFAEAAGIFSLIILHIWWLRSRMSWFWIVILGLILLSHALRKETPSGLGFTMRNFKSSVLRYGPVLLGVTAFLLLLGFLLRWNRAIAFESGLASFGLYCAWGLFQQYLLNGYFVNRFRGLERGQAPILAALLFAAAHVPNLFLMAVGLIAGYFSAQGYIRYRNLYFLGIAHGIIGFLIYFAVPDSISRHLYVGPGYFRHGF